ncbi:MAG: hypothetical protein KC877_04275 [Candidatus Kaiserbacteria bacterium]|nr:hypothetical protein [Candidatus Kaiserbacteria bacterium]MCB9815979.1 hypothetical protein [Candidatus Nomurabacteria bacterium]
MNWKNILLGVIWSVLLIAILFFGYIVSTIQGNAEAMNVFSHFGVFVPLIIGLIILGIIIAIIITVSVSTSKKVDSLTDTEL